MKTPRIKKKTSLHYRKYDRSIGFKNKLENPLNCDYFVTTKNHDMNLAVVSIGNSKGIRIPKSILKKYDIKDEVELILEKGYIILKPIATPRKGWNQAFQEMNNNGDDALLIEDSFEDENWEEWK